MLFTIKQTPRVSFSRIMGQITNLMDVAHEHNRMLSALNYNGKQLPCLLSEEIWGAKFQPSDIKQEVDVENDEYATPADGRAKPESPHLPTKDNDDDDNRPATNPYSPGTGAPSPPPAIKNDRPASPSSSHVLSPRDEINSTSFNGSSTITS